MVLVVEEGAGLPDADSYGSLVNASLYATNFGRSEFLALSDANKEIRLRVTTQFLDTFYEWPSRPLKPDQSLQFPREELSIESRVINGIPVQITKALYELATFPGLPELTPDQQLSKFISRSVKLEGLEKKEDFRGYIPPKHFWVVEGLLRDLKVGALGGGISYNRVVRT